MTQKLSAFLKILFSVKKEVTMPNKKKLKKSLYYFKLIDLPVSETFSVYPYTM